LGLFHGEINYLMPRPLLEAVGRDAGREGRGLKLYLITL
jgi:hypothetical protein